MLDRGGRCCCRCSAQRADHRRSRADPAELQAPLRSRSRRGATSTVSSPSRASLWLECTASSRCHAASCPKVSHAQGKDVVRRTHLISIECLAETLWLLKYCVLVPVRGTMSRDSILTATEGSDISTSGGIRRQSWNRPGGAYCHRSGRTSMRRGHPSVFDMPGYRLHPLRGDLREFWSISISARLENHLSP